MTGASGTRFAIVIAAPTVIVNALGIALMIPATPMRYLLVIPMAAHLSGCLGDWWTLIAVSRLSRGVVIEDTEDGFAYHQPTPPN